MADDDDDEDDRENWRDKEGGENDEEKMSLEKRLRDLREMYEEGVLDKGEHDKEKARLLEACAIVGQDLDELHAIDRVLASPLFVQQVRVLRSAGAGDQPVERPADDRVFLDREPGDGYIETADRERIVEGQGDGATHPDVGSIEGFE